jgi:hypothetical protein
MLKEGENLDNFRGKSSRIHPSYSKLESQEEHICRICMDFDSKDNPLITPCKCSGSVKYIHEECLKTWLVSQDVDIDKGECELCKTPFSMEFKIGRRCSIKESLSNGWSHFIYLPVLFAVMIMLFLVIYLLAERYININQREDEQGYTIALMVTCGICGFVLLLLIVNTIKEICFIPSLDEWHIFSQNFAHESLEEPQKVENIENEFQGNFMIVPEKISVKGVKVNIPELKPNLASLNQRGRIVAYASRAESSGGDDGSFSINQRLNSEPTRLYFQ